MSDRKQQDSGDIVVTDKGLVVPLRTKLIFPAVTALVAICASLIGGAVSYGFTGGAMQSKNEEQDRRLGKLEERQQDVLRGVTRICQHFDIVPCTKEQ